MPSPQPRPFPGLLLLVLVFLGSVPPIMAIEPAEVESPTERPAFFEVWAYLSVGEESAWTAELPVTDLGYFAASINSWGELTSIPDVTKLKAFKGRKHLVVALLENAAQAHLVLHPEFSVRARLLDDLVKAAGPFDGLQLDFESVTTRDKESYWSFLAELKRRLGEKILSVAIPARTRLIADAYDYRLLDRTVDRIIIMAYDEHWSGGPPGPVSSLEWGKRVAQFAQSTIGPSRLVMGIPFYGRAWADKALSRAYRSNAVRGLFSAPQAGPLQRSAGIPHFEYEELVRVKVFFDDGESHRVRLDQYAALGVRHLAFWRLGQESPDFWSLLRLASQPPAR